MLLSSRRMNCRGVKRGKAGKLETDVNENRTKQGELISAYGPSSEKSAEKDNF